MSFSSVPIRSNGVQVTAAWWNLLRSAGVALESTAITPGAHNFILNSMMRYWQTNVDLSIARSGAAVNAYAADQILTRNEMTAPATIRAQRVAGINTLYAYQLTVTAKTDNNGTYDSFFIIGNLETQLLYNQNIVFKCKVKAVANVDRIDIQFGYGTTEVFNSANTLDTATNFVINNSTFTDCEKTIAVGTTPTLSGMLWVRIRANRASSGHQNDVGNGVIIEQPMLCIGTVAPSNFFPAYRDGAVELNALERYYEKSFNTDTTAPTATNVGALYIVNGNSSVMCVQFRAVKRLAPTITTYPITSTTPGQILHVSSGAQAATPTEVGQTKF